jgi:hypothetical protein
LSSRNRKPGDLVSQRLPGAFAGRQQRRRATCGPEPLTQQNCCVQSLRIHSVSLYPSNCPHAAKKRRKGGSPGVSLLLAKTTLAGKACRRPRGNAYANQTNASETPAANRRDVFSRRVFRRIKIAAGPMVFGGRYPTWRASC